MAQPNQVSPTPTEYGAAITTNTTTQVYTGPCIFDGISVTAVGTGSSAAVYDNTSATGNPVVLVATTVLGVIPTIGDGILFGKGICIVSSGTGAATFTPLFARYIP
jgi:hypothetical protein